MTFLGFDWEQTVLPTKNRDGIIIKIYVYIKEYIDFILRHFYIESLISLQNFIFISIINYYKDGRSFYYKKNKMSLLLHL